jgi:hypothetical protein
VPESEKAPAMLCYVGVVATLPFQTSVTRLILI